MIFIFLFFSFLIATSAQGMELAPKNEGFSLQQLPNGPITEIANQITAFDISDASYSLRALACTSRKLNEKINNSEITKRYVQSLIDNHPDFFKPYPQSAWPSIAAILIGTEQTKSLINTAELQAMPKVDSTINNFSFLEIDSYDFFIDYSTKKPLSRPYIYFFCIKHDTNPAMKEFNKEDGPACFFDTLKTIKSVQDKYKPSQITWKIAEFSISNIPFYSPLFIEYLVQTGQKYFFSCLYSTPFDKEKKTPLALAIEYNFPRLYIEAYLQQIPNEDLSKVICYEPDNYYSRQTALGIATGKNHRCSIVESLIARGVDPNIPDEKGWFPIFNSIYKNCLNCTQLLTQAHNRFDRYPKKIPHMAVLYGHQQIIKMLFENWPKSIEWEDKNGSTPLIYAIGNKHYKNAQLLLSLGANPNTAFNTIKQLGSNHVGSTALAWLITETILNYTELNYTDSSDLSLVEQKKLLKSLINSGADPNIPRLDGLLPLHMIVNSEAAFNYQPKDFYNPLIIDVYRNSIKKKVTLQEKLELTKILVDGGANRNKKDRFGRSSLMIFLTTHTYEISNSDSKNGYVLTEKKTPKPENNGIVSDIIDLLVTPENVCDVDPETNMNLQDYLDHFGIEPTPRIIQAQQEWEKRNSMNVFGSWALGTTALIAIKFFTKH